ncbi:vacuolar membrane-associated protein iml1, partial [Coemansia sp. RSA 2603]
LYFQDLVYDDATGRYYRDYYKVIADMEVRADWTVVLPEILSEFNSYRRDIQELVSSAGHRLRGDLSRAGQGNVLEAINLGINSFASNHVDRDLARTGLSTVVITPSFGVFDVDKDLLRMTTERMLHFGLRVDLVCLAPKPLFRPPVFRFRSHPVPSEQEQRRALQNRRAAKEDAEKAKAAGMNSLSPRAESPGAHIASGGSGSANNGGGGQSTTLSKDRGAKAMANVKPENVVAVDPIMLDPLYFDGDRWESELLPFLLGTHVRGGAWQSGGSSESRNSSERLAQTRAGGSAINALLSSMDSAVDDIPDTIKELTLDDYPFFAGRRAADRRVTYCYFPYWVDCGFYDYTDERGAERPDAFRPACQMGSLAGDGASTYLRTAPVIPDVQLRAMDAELAALLGLPAAGNTAEAQPADEHMALRELFDRFDRRAIVGTGVSVLAHPADGVAGGPTDAVDVLLTAPHTGMRSMTSSANDTRLASHASHVSVGPGTAAYWDEHGMRPRGDLGLPTVSTSASPNLPHAGRSASARPTKQAAVSSSVPRETSINVAAAAAAAGRASVFGAQRRKPQASRSGSAESAESGELPVSMAAVAAGSAKWRGASPQSGGRVAGPAGHMRLPSDAVPVAVAMAMAVPPPPAAERSAVSESIAKQSHMDDHQQPSQQQLLHQPPSQSPSQPLSQPLSHHSSGHPAFQLTLPAGRAIPPAPPVSTAPGDARHASPQPARTVWLSERHALGTHVAEQVRGRGPPAYNPCNPSLAPLPHTELSQRWAMAFPTYWLLSSFSPKWRSLCTPASLPLVTDYQPANLDSFYSRFSYFVQTPGLAATALPAGHDDEEFAQFVAA